MNLWLLGLSSTPAPSPLWPPLSVPVLAPLFAIKLQQICFGHHHDSSSSFSDQSYRLFLLPPHPLFAELYSNFPFWKLVFCQKFHSKIKRGSPLILGSCNKYTIVLSLPRYPGFLINCGVWRAGCLQKRGGKRGGRGSWQKPRYHKMQPRGAEPTVHSVLRGGGNSEGGTRQSPSSLPAPGSGIGRERLLALISVG